ncbi:MAG TPA: DUF952 domain-containing protein [Nakamurella sp.]
MADLPALSDQSDPPGRLIYHCALVADWQAAQSARSARSGQSDQTVGEYTISSRGRTLEQEGFVHAGYAGQIAGVLQRFYADVAEPMCLLIVDPDKVGAPVIAENLNGGTELFPHIYGPIPVSAVVDVTGLVRDGQAGWRSPVG